MALDDKAQHRPMSSMRMDPDLRRNDRSRKSKLNTMRSEWIQGGLQKLDDRAIRSNTWFVLLIVLVLVREVI
jgi:hypothetical protein